MTIPRHIIRLRAWVCWPLFFILLALYWVTTPDTVSFWDCPEYVSAAYLLEIGHPPGNPFWMIVERVITMLAPSPQYAAYAVNMSSGLFTALTALLLAFTIFDTVWWILQRRSLRGIPPEWGAAGAAVIGALTFGVLDSTWYSAVEAEVYAMSIFFTALCVRLMSVWAYTSDPRRANRMLVLISYLFGLSLGVHQLNLLCIPALALIWGLRRGIRSPLKITVIIILGMGAVACVLLGVMPASIAIAADLELFCVNTLGLPRLAGVVIYLLILGASLLLALLVTTKSHNRGAVAAAAFPAIFLSGMFCIGSNLLLGAAVSALMTLLLVRPNHFDVRRLNLAFWMLAMLLVGYGAYALIPIRGAIPSPANPTMPGDPFSFAAYQAREQYGAAPLLYGYTPFSKPLLREEYVAWDSIPHYNRYLLASQGPKVVPAEKEGRLAKSITGLTADDSLSNANVMRRDDANGYLVKGYNLKNIFTPELNIWFPRITSRDPADLPSYRDWAGMDTASMDKVAISSAVDSLGRPVAITGADGKKVPEWSYRPTMLQNLSYLASYQVSYMYLRYLMWNFAGRQNDIPSQGQVEHGNFITGFPAVDNLMLGAEDQLPSEAGSANKGRNVYFMIPFLLGIAGVIWLFQLGHRGRNAGAVSLLMFIMTGVAIVIYLNQTPCEPRERDYSFLGSFWIFSAWVGCGTLLIARLCRCRWVLPLLLVVPGWMAFQNFDDHDRRGRRVALTTARATLESLDRDAIFITDGDNFTFPLWYAQEVEGIRRDVRVVNFSYLKLPQYAAKLHTDWNGSKCVPLTLSRGDIIYDALLHVSIQGSSHDTLPAAEILHSLRTAPNARINARYARIAVGMDSVTIDLQRLSSTGSGNAVNFSNLMVFDMIASNGASGGRPIYWSRMLTGKGKICVDTTLLTPSLFAWKFGVHDDAAVLAELRRGVEAVGLANDPLRDVYMDPTPAKMAGAHRAALLQAARTFIDRGHLDDAWAALWKADMLFGHDIISFININYQGKVFNSREVLGNLQLELAREMAVLSRADIPSKVIELRARGHYNLRQAALRHESWHRYRQALPERLSGFTSH